MINFFIETRSRKYIHIEKVIKTERYPGIRELKACNISNRDKGKLFRSMNNVIKFGALIDQRRVKKIYLKIKIQNRDTLTMFLK